MAHGNPGEEVMKSWACWGDQAVIIDAKEEMQATVVLDGWGGEGVRGMTFVRVNLGEAALSRTGPGLTTSMATGPERTTAFRGRELRRRGGVEVIAGYDRRAGRGRGEGSAVADGVAGGGAERVGVGFEETVGREGDWTGAGGVVRRR